MPRKSNTGQQFYLKELKRRLDCTKARLVEARSNRVTAFDRVCHERNEDKKGDLKIAVEKLDIEIEILENCLRRTKSEYGVELAEYKLSRLD